MKKRLLAVMIVIAILLGEGSVANAYKPKHYSPKKVVKLAMQICKDNGMISTADHLKAALKEGRITKEEFEDYYPTDGLGYYSVFVETDLKKASTISGRRLRSVRAIAEHIAGMMLLEKEPYFYIAYKGKIKYRKTTYYEFRCYR